MKSNFFTALVTSALFSAALLASPAGAKKSTDHNAQASLTKLINEVDIPYKKFTLDNGLTVIIHEDHKAPIVAVSVWYGVGSKNEVAGKTGYAHLFEHIMFNGSENAPKDYFAYLDKIGATNYNGTTSFDRTNYFQNVPTSALESALFLESDRMGNLLGAVTQEKLDNQIGVVQNEKRQGDNQPYGLVSYVEWAELFPAGHPYHHTPIGSMDDLSVATLDDMHHWFQNHYGPNNAVLVLAGDVTAETALPLVQKWFGRFPAGPAVEPLSPALPELSERKTIIMYDKVPTTRLIYDWAVPGMGSADELPLSVGAHVLGGLASSRLDNILVRDEQLAVGVRASVQSYQHAGIFSIEIDVKPGVDIDLVQKRLDEILADYIKNGPTQDEVDRVTSSNAAGTIGGLEAVGGFGGKAVTLAEGELYYDNPAHFKTELADMAKLKPEAITNAMQTWLTKPVLEVRVLQGKRGQGDAEPVDVSASTKIPNNIEARNQPATYSKNIEADTAAAVSEADLNEKAHGNAPDAEQDLTQMPEAGAPEPLKLPSVEHTTLSNGVTVYFARRDAVPIVRVAVSFEGGYSSDPLNKRGLAAFSTRVMQEGTTSRNATQLAEEEERLGASVFGDSGLETVQFGVTAVRPNLDGSLALLADIVRNPAFAETEIERARGQQLTDIEAEMTSPSSLAFRVLPGLLYGADHPYGASFTGTGDAEVVAGLSKSDLEDFHRFWIRPDLMTIYVVGDTSLNEITPMLEKHFGSWKPAVPRAATVRIVPAAESSAAKIIVIDRPDSPQTFIMAGELLPYTGSDELTPVYAANEILGGTFLSRLNMDLRETKGWAYGARSMITRVKGQIPFIAYAPVQADKTGLSIIAMMDNFNGFLTDKGPAQDELDRVVTATVLEMPGSYETASSVLGQMITDDRYGRPFDYAEGTAARYEALTIGDLEAAFGGKFDPSKLVWIVIGDADIIRPQLEAIGIPVEYRTLED